MIRTPIRAWLGSNEAVRLDENTVDIDISWIFCRTDNRQGPGFELTLAKGAKYTFLTSSEAQELIAYMWNGLKKRSRHVIATQDINPESESPPSPYMWVCVCVSVSVSLCLCLLFYLSHPSLLNLYLSFLISSFFQCLFLLPSTFLVSFSAVPQLFIPIWLFLSDLLIVGCWLHGRWQWPPGGQKEWPHSLTIQQWRQGTQSRLVLWRECPDFP